MTESQTTPETSQSEGCSGTQHGLHVWSYICDCGYCDAVRCNACASTSFATSSINVTPHAQEWDYRTP